MSVEKIRRNCTPSKLCGRKVWVSERGGYGNSVKEVWVHFSPFHDARIYVKGTSLTEGDDAANLAYLEDLCRDKIGTASPITKKMEAIWDDEFAERAAYDRAECF